MRCYGIPVHAWTISFFIFLSSKVGKHVCCDENVYDFSKMDVPIIMVRTSCGMLINEVFNVRVNKVSFRVIMVEETLGPSTRLAKKEVSSTSSEDSFLFSQERPS